MAARVMKARKFVAVLPIARLAVRPWRERGVFAAWW
jgi:hypothetical protein